MLGVLGEVIPFWGPFGRFYVGPTVWLARLSFGKPELQSGDLRIEPVLSPVSLVTLVGENMAGRPNVAGKFLNSVGAAGIAVRAVAQGASWQ